jgi:hypothetical protein
MLNKGKLSLPRDPYDAFRLQNDVVGVRLWGPVTQPTLIIGKSDIWDRRWFGERQPLITTAKIKELAMADRLAEIAQSPNSTNYDLYGKYDFPCPKPGAQLILGTPFASDASFSANEDGSVQLSITGERKELCVNIWVALMQSLVILEFSSKGIEPDDLWVRIYRHQDTILPGQPVDPTIGGGISPCDFEPLPVSKPFISDDCWGISQKFLQESTFPEGFHFALLATAIGIETVVKCHENEHNLGTPLWAKQEGRLSHGIVKRYKPINEAAGSAVTASFLRIPESFAIMVTIVTTQDDVINPATAVKAMKEIKELGIQKLRVEQSEALGQGQRKKLARARVSESTNISANPFVYPNLRKKGGYYGDVPLCSVDSTKLCFQDAALWHADFHLNEIRAESILTLGQFEELMPYCEMIHTLLPGAKENARDVYDLPGAMYPLVHFPLRCKGVAHTNLTWEQDMGLNGLICKPLWLYYRYTGDMEFLRNLAYPVLKECARFCSAYLTEGEDGRLHVIPTVSPEHWGLTPRFERNRDCTSAITLIRYLLHSSANGARILNEDISEAESWESSAQRLVSYPTYMTESGLIWTDVDNAPPIEYNIPVPLSPIFWGDDVGLDSAPEVLEIAKRTLEHINVWVPHRGYLDSCIRPRLGIYNPGVNIGVENLLLSYQSIHLFPAVPSDVEIVIKNFAAEGGFRVSAIRSADNDIHDVRIESTLGGLCRISNPWPGKVARATRDDVEIFHSDGSESIIVFHTDIGGTYELKEP